MNILKILVLISAFSVSALGDQTGKGGLTAIDREPCVMLPSLKQVDALVPGSDYIASHEFDCDDDDDINTCHSYQGFLLKYSYTTIRKTDYYTADGKLITSKESKDKFSIEESIHGFGYGQWKEISLLAGYEPVDDSAKQALEQSYDVVSKIVLVGIRQKLNEATDICAGSFYK